MYRHLTDERRRYIDDLSEQLRSSYLTDYGIDFQKMALDLGINFVVTDKLGGEWAIRRNLRNYVLTPKYFITDVNRYAIAHGFGHTILQHSKDISEEVKEDEANYFAEKLTGITNTNVDILLFFECILQILRHPIRSFKYACNKDGGDIDRLIEDL